MVAKQKKNNVKKENGPTKAGLFSRIRNDFDNYKVRFASGLLFVAFSFYLAIAFFSFIKSGFADRSKLDISLWKLISDPEIQVENITGKFGAFVSDILINNGLGLGSFSLIIIVFIIGIRMLGARILPIKQTILHSAIISIWLSVTLGFFFLNALTDKYLLLGGAHGFLVSNWLKSLIGWIGTFLTILISLFVYMAINFDWFIPMVKKPLKLKTKTIMGDEALIEMEDGKPVDEIEDENEEEDDEFDKSVAIGIPFEKETPFTFQTKIIDTPDETESDENLVFKIEKGESEEVMQDYENLPQGDYDPTLDLSSYKMPGLDLLEEHKKENTQIKEAELIFNKNKIVKTLEDYKIQIKSIKATVGPTVTLYEIVPMPGVRISKIKNLEDDIALSLAALGIRIIAPIPGEGTIGIEVPNSEPEIVSMKSIISSKKFQTTNYELPIALGKTISNETFIIDLAKTPHMLVAGATGQGKSVGLNAIITSLLYKKHPSQLKFVLVDPKKVELNIYSKIEKHYLAKMPDEDEPIITDVQRVVFTLNSLTSEMEDRYELLKKAHTRNIKEYNQKFVKRVLNPDKGHRFLPYIVVIIDEFADLIMTAGKEVELPIARIAQLARAVGIHMIIATQRPSTNIITGVIKANFPTRVAFKVASMIDSRTILDSPGANQLIGRGDMLVSQGSDLVRVQCAFVDTPEVERIIDFIGAQNGYPTAFLLPEYHGEANGSEAGDVDLSKKDPMFEDAAKVIVANQSGSTSLIQRRFSIGYNRAGRIMDQLEAAGIVGPSEGSKARQVLIMDEMQLERIFDNFR